MKSPQILIAFIARKWIISLLIILFSTSKPEGQPDIPQAGLLCISDCETCPVICSPPPPSSLSATPRSPLPPPPSSSPPPLPPPPVHHHSPPQVPYYFASPSPSYPPPALRPPSPPSGSSVTSNPPPSLPQPNIPWGGAFPTPPSVYVYGPGNMGQRNFTYPYYYFYASKASCHLPLHQAFIFLVVFIFFQFLS